MKLTNSMVDGVSIVNETLWMVQPVTDGAYEGWIGTGIDTLFLRFLDLRGAIDYFLGRFPGTVGIRSTLDGKYTYADLAAAARNVYLDKVMAVIEPSQSTDSTITMNGGEKMDAPPDVRCGSCGRVPNPISAPCPDCPDRDVKER